MILLDHCAIAAVMLDSALAGSLAQLMNLRFITGIGLSGLVTNMVALAV